MFRLPLRLVAIAVAFAAACVTINVYFPAAAAEEAADRIIDDVWGPAADDDEAQSAVRDVDRALESIEPVRLAAANVLDLLVPPANAQANLDIDTPEIRALTRSMNQRFPKLKPHFDSGAVGFSDDALTELRDRNAVPLARRNAVRQLVDAENKDRNALYKAIAEANGRPEWEADIRKTFAARWVARAEPGWYYRSGGGWNRK